jgi:Ni2+-binding GTPase involved in maturation of urease and hydrogenase
MRGLENLKLANGDLSFGGDRQKIVTLVGCSGAGKTTTLAKIASRQSGFAQRRVAFISLDYYRIAANSELQVYAKILDIPLAVVSNQSALAEALRNFQDCDLILIDTPGFIADHPDYLNVLSILTSSGIPMDFYLVSSAPTREQECLRTINQLDLLPVTGFIFTKLDECHACGHLLNLLLRTKIPVAFATHGNRIPEDIEPMSSERLAQIILKDETVGPAPSEEKRTLEANGGSLGRQAGVYSPRFGFGDPGQGAVEATPESKTDRKPYREETAPPDFGERGGNAAGGPGPSVYYVANKKTDLYHLPMCESAKRIKAANIEYFQTRAAAEQESYQPCRLCVLDASMNQYSMPARYAV